MNYFSAAPTELKMQSVDQPKPLLLTKDQVRLASASLPYAIPTLITLLPKKADGLKMGKMKKGKGKKATEVNGLGPRVKHVFPSPQSVLDHNTIYSFVQTVQPVQYTTSTVVETSAAYNFTLNALSNSSTFGSLFDQYRVALIEYVVMPRYQVVDTITNPGQYVTAIDFDDSATVSYAGLCEYPNANLTEGNKPRKYVFVPHIAVAAYSGAFTSFMNEEAPWIDLASNTVQHYGLKMAFTATSSAQVLDIKIRVLMQMRNAR